MTWESILDGVGKFLQDHGGHARYHNPSDFESLIETLGCKADLPTSVAAALAWLASPERPSEPTSLIADIERHVRKYVANPADPCRRAHEFALARLLGWPAGSALAPGPSLSARALKLWRRWARRALLVLVTMLVERCRKGVLCKSRGGVVDKSSWRPGLEGAVVDYRARATKVNYEWIAARATNLLCADVLRCHCWTCFGPKGVVAAVTPPAKGNPKKAYDKCLRQHHIGVWDPSEALHRTAKEDGSSANLLSLWGFVERAVQGMVSSYPMLNGFPSGMMAGVLTGKYGLTMRALPLLHWQCTSCAAWKYVNCRQKACPFIPAGPVQALKRLLLYPPSPESFLQVKFWKCEHETKTPARDPQKCLAVNLFPGSPACWKCGNSRPPGSRDSTGYQYILPKPPPAPAMPPVVPATPESDRGARPLSATLALFDVHDWNRIGEMLEEEEKKKPDGFLCRILSLCYEAPGEWWELLMCGEIVARRPETLEEEQNRAKKWRSLMEACKDCPDCPGVLATLQEQWRAKMKDM